MMNRKQLYYEIASLNLKEVAKNKYNKNYTQCSNEELQRVVDEASAKIKKLQNKNTDTSKCLGTKCNQLYKLVEILAKKKILLNSEVYAIMKS